MHESIRTHQDVGKLIRRLRREHSMTGLELAEKAKVSQSRISKIETGAIQTSIKEIKLILNILKCPKNIQQQVTSVIELRSNLPSYKFRPLLNVPNAIFKKESHTAHLSCFVMNALPALLQTPLYREALLKSRRFSTANITQKMNEAMKRQDLLWDKKQTFHFIIQETALYTRLTSHADHLAQLDRIIRFSTMKNIRIGVIPVHVGLLAVENGNFVLYDNTGVTIASESDDLYLTEPEAIVEYVKVFSELDKKALYDQEALVVIDKAMEFFSV